MDDLDDLDDLDYLNRAIEFEDMAVNSTPGDHPKRAIRLSNLGKRLGIRFEWTGSMDDLNRTVEVANLAVDSTPEDHPERAHRLNNLGNWLHTRFEQTGSMDDLDRAIKVIDMAVDSTPKDHPERATRLNNISIWLGTRSMRSGSMDDLNHAIEVADTIVGCTPEDHHERASRLSNLGIWLGLRFKRTGLMDDLDRAVKFTEMAVVSTPEDYPERAGRLNNLSACLGLQFDRTGSIDDLNRAVEVADMVIYTTPQDHPERGIWLNNFGTWLGTRFDRTGSMNDLDRAIKVIDMAVDSTPEDHPERATRLNSLSIWLGTRFDRTGSMNDLDRAIKVIDMAVGSTPTDHPERATRFNNLGIWLGARFKRTGSTDDLNRAIRAAGIAVDSTPEDHPERAGWLNNLGNRLGMQFEQTGSIEDLNRAIKAIGIAVDSTPEDHPERAPRLNNLGIWLGTRFKRTGSMDDLNRAVEVADIAVNSTPQDHPERATRLNNLASSLRMRFEWTGSIDDLDRALSAIKEGWNCRSATPSIRIRLAQHAASILASRFNWEESSQLLREAVELLPAVSPRSLEHTDKQSMLAAFVGLASRAAATALNAGKQADHALQILELGRGVIAGLLLELRGDISDLKQQHPDLADEFVSLRDMLDSPPDQKAMSTSDDTMLSWEFQASRRRDADQKLSETLTKIRATPGFHNFLLPPTVDELIAAAEPDPIIVINLSSYRCDAFLVESTQIRVLELPTLKLQEVQERTQGLRLSSLATSSYPTPLLEWLWDTVSRPVLDSLCFKKPPSDRNWPRVWWIPTGVLSQLPLHAAGYHTRGSSETVLDRVMSSYASSIKSLIFGRRHEIPVSPLSDHALLVAMNETPGLSTSQVLPYVQKEADMLNDLCPSLQLKPISTARRKNEVLKHLQGCRIFHFAGHGQLDPAEPSQSCLLLEDWKTDPLTVADLRDYRLQENPPFLGYLSACSTGANTADTLADEGIHLVSAFQLAGFRHVVGTLWEVSDKYCVDVARVLYQTLRDEGMTDVAVCRGLHQALRELRAGHADTGQEARKAFHLDLGTPEKALLNSHWIPYVHFGV